MGTQMRVVPRANGFANFIAPEQVPEIKRLWDAFYGLETMCRMLKIKTHVLRKHMAVNGMRRTRHEAVKGMHERNRSEASLSSS